MCQPLNICGRAQPRHSWAENTACWAPATSAARRPERCLFSNIDNLTSFISYSCNYCSQMAYVQIILWPFFLFHNFLELSCETKMQYEAMIYIFSFSSGKNFFVIMRTLMIRNWKMSILGVNLIFLTPSLFVKMMYCNTLWSDDSTKTSQKPINPFNSSQKLKEKPSWMCFFSTNENK